MDVDRVVGAGYWGAMEESNISGSGEGFDPSSRGAGNETKAPWRAFLPQDLSRTTKQAAKVAFAKAGMSGVGEAGVLAGGMAGAKTRAEAAKIVRETTKAAINHYSDPENLAKLGAKLTVLMADYGCGKAERLSDTKRAEVEADLEFGDEGEKAVGTKVMIDIYNGAVKNLRKAARKSGDRSFLDDGQGGEISEALLPAELSDAYDKATTRDRRYVWTLETDKDGRSRVVRKNSATLRDWAGHTVDGMSSGASLEDGIGFLMGSSLRAVFRLLPGVGEVDGKDQLRAKAARLYQQVESLIPSRKNPIHPHGSPGERAEGAGGLSEEGKGVIIPGMAFTPRPSGGSFAPSMTGVRHGSREARHAERG